MTDILLVFLIVLISYDKTLFLQSLLSQPIFSCILIGLLVDNIQLAFYIGTISQLITSAYMPVGGSNTPDFQMSSNLFLVVFRDNEASLQLIGQILPFLILLSIISMYVVVLERKVSTIYIKKIPYEKIDLKFMLWHSYAIHLLLFLSIAFIFHLILLQNKTAIIELTLFDPIRLLVFVAFFSLGSLGVQYARRGFSQ